MAERCKKRNSGNISGRKNNVKISTTIKWWENFKLKKSGRKISNRKKWRKVSKKNSGKFLGEKKWLENFKLKKMAGIFQKKKKN